MCTPDDYITAADMFVSVVLHNPGPYGSGASSGSLQFWYTPFGSTAAWSTAQWTLFTTKAVTAYPGDTTVTSPLDLGSAGHYCIVARRVSGTDPMNFEGPNITANTEADNNIAWHIRSRIYYIDRSSGFESPWIPIFFRETRPILDQVPSDGAEEGAW